MRILNFIEKNFWLFFTLSCGLALIFPAGGKFFSVLLIPLLMIILFFTCLKIDIKEIFEYIKKPVFISYIVFMYLIIFPLIIFYIFRFINPELAIGFLILAAVPPGVSSPFLTNVLKGNTGLSLVITIIASILAPFTIAGLLHFTTNTIVQIDTIGILKTLLLVGVAPLIISQIVRIAAGKFVKRTQVYYSGINTILMSLFIYFSFSNQAKEILADPYSILTNLMFLYLLYVILHVIGYFTAFWRNKQDKIALSITRTYMNNGLAIVIAFGFFSPKIALLMVLSEFPWSTMLGVFKYVLRFVK